MSRNSKRPRQKPPSPAHPHDSVEAPGLDDEFDGRPASVQGTILHHDDAFSVINKPAAIPTEELLAALVCGEDEVGAEDAKIEVCLPQVIYPLDSGASGLLLVSGARDVAANLARQMAEKTLEVRCLALVRGRPAQQVGKVGHRLLDNRPGSGMVRIDAENGQPALTEWRLLESYVGFALLECIPRTAIMSQIRVHLQAEGLPLVVDPRYGGGTELLLSSFKAGYRPSRRREERPLIERLTLHAQTLTFAHPISGAPMRFDAPPPKDFKAAMHQLDRFGRMAP